MTFHPVTPPALCKRKGYITWAFNGWANSYIIGARSLYRQIIYTTRDKRSNVTLIEIMRELLTGADWMTRYDVVDLVERNFDESVNPLSVSGTLTRMVAAGEVETKPWPKDKEPILRVQKRVRPQLYRKKEKCNG